MIHNNPTIPLYSQSIPPNMITKLEQPLMIASNMFNLPLLFDWVKSIVIVLYMPISHIPNALLNVYNITIKTNKLSSPVNASLFKPYMNSMTNYTTVDSESIIPTAADSPILEQN